jgi:uncharacterized protein YdaU (DUF1376 family)
MPLYVADYQRKTTRLTLEQHGAYLLLIMDYWVNGAPPDDDAVLAAIIRSSPAVWRRLRPVLAQFFTIADDRWTQSRVEEERSKAVAITEMRRAAGKQSQSKRPARVQASVGTHGATHAQANWQQMPQQDGQQNGKQTTQQNGQQTKRPSPSPSEDSFQGSKNSGEDSLGLGREDAGPGPAAGKPRVIDGGKA